MKKTNVPADVARALNWGNFFWALLSENRQSAKHLIIHDSMHKLQMLAVSLDYGDLK